MEKGTKESTKVVCLREFEKSIKIWTVTAPIMGKWVTRGALAQWCDRLQKQNSPELQACTIASQ
jgi:hypothetical protein